MEKTRLLKKILVTAGLLLSVGPAQVLAQETILASGGDATGNGGTASYSVGQVFYAVHSLTGGSITEGVQQPYEIYAITGTAEADRITLEFRAYPNPVTDFLFLKAELTVELQLFYRLYDSNGRMLCNKKITGDECIVPMDRYAPGIYYLDVISREKNLRTFKIIKY